VVTESIKKPLRFAYAIAYCVLYGMLPVFWWGAKDWSIAIPMVVAMASLQWLLFYIGAKRDAARKKEASRLERLCWPLGHASILAGYFFAYHAIVVSPYVG
jgi:hypothetical protein